MANIKKKVDSKKLSRDVFLNKEIKKIISANSRLKDFSNVPFSRLEISFFVILGIALVVCTYYIG